MSLIFERGAASAADETAIARMVARHRLALIAHHRLKPRKAAKYSSGAPSAANMHKSALDI